MKKIVICLFTLLAVTSFSKENYSFAQKEVVSFKQEAMDRKFERVVYKPNVVYEVYGQPFMATAIVFDRSEEVINYSLSDPAWTGIINSNQMYIKPPAEEFDINGESILPPESTLFISTNKRDYYFKLKVTNTRAYNPVIQFIYPEDQIKLIENLELEKQERDRRRTGLEITTFDDLNFNYKWNKKYSWSPQIIMDNGTRTIIYLSIDDTDVPAFFIKKDGEVEKIEYIVKKNKNGYKQIELNTTFKEAILQLHTKKITIINKAKK